MDFSNFNIVFQWIISHGYSLMFVAMCIEGPIVTAAASFAAALGNFNIYIIFILAFLGDVLPDALYYAAGYWGRYALVDRFGRYFGLSGKRMSHIEELAKKHSGKTIVGIKLTPMLPLPGLMLMGASKMNFKKFISIISLFTIPKVILFMILGFYFGYMYDAVSRYVENIGLVILLFLAIIFIIYRFYHYVTGMLAKKIGKI
jgi:membrane protein DedA with SNARE-associated domain